MKCKNRGSIVQLKNRIVGKYSLVISKRGFLVETWNLM